MAKSAAERKRDQRQRDKQSEEERLSRLLSRTIKLDLFKATDYALIRGMTRMGIDEPQHFLTRLIHAADNLSDDELASFVDTFN